MMKFRTQRNTQSGFTLLLATLVASLLLLLGASIFGLVKKEVVLSSIGRDSQFAFYAADTAAECALYWDLRYNYFASSTPGVTPLCDGQNISNSITGSPGAFPYTREFEYEPNGLCARVSVTHDDQYPNTDISARGYNTSCADIALNPRTLERAVRLRY